MMVLGIIFLAGASETLVFTTFSKGFQSFFLAGRSCTPRNVRFPNGFLRVFGKPCSGIIFLGTRSGKLENTTFSNGFAWFCSILSCQIIFSWQARSGIVGFCKVF